MEQFKWSDSLVREFIEFGRRSYHISDADIIGLDINKFKASKEKPILFTTYDGIVIRKGDSYAYTPKNTMSYINCSDGYSIPQPKESFLYFSSKENAEHYVLMNKSCISPTEWFENIDNRGFYPKMVYDRIQGLKEQEDAFNASRELNGAYSKKYKNFNDYQISKHSGMFYGTF